MEKLRKKISINVVVWGICFPMFFILMTDQYCRMTFGGSLLHVISGGIAITEEEREYLHERDTLIYGETLDSFPAQLYDPSLKEENGFAVDLAKQLSLEIGRGITFEPTLWKDVFTRLENGDIDIIQISYSKERAEKYYLTDPIYKSRGIVFLKNDAEKLKKLEELPGKN